MKNNVAIITGAASGIGLEISNLLAKLGVLVYMMDSRGEEVALNARILQQHGYAATGVPCDVTNEGQFTSAIENIIEINGGVDILVNNAGKQYISPIEIFPTDQFELLLKLMVTVPFIAIKSVFPAMKSKRYGRIINVASVNGLIGFPGKAAYNSAKHGVIGLTKVAALEGANYGITVNAVCPGYVDTPMVREQLLDLANSRNIDVSDVFDEIIFPLVPQNRLLEVNEIADYVAFLVSERAKGITGQAIVIDGGYTVQ